MFSLRKKKIFNYPELVRNYQNLPITNPMQDILGTNAYAKFE